MIDYDSFTPRLLMVCSGPTNGAEVVARRLEEVARQPQEQSLADQALRRNVAWHDAIVFGYLLQASMFRQAAIKTPSSGLALSHRMTRVAAVACRVHLLLEWRCRSGTSTVLLPHAEPTGP